MFGEIESGGRYAVGQQDAEFLTAKATEDIALAQVSPAREDCVLQHLIAHGMPVGTAYAIWTGIGASGTAILGMTFYEEPRDLVRIGCLTLIVAGAFGLKFTSPAKDAGEKPGVAIEQPG